MINSITKNLNSYLFLLFLVASKPSFSQSNHRDASLNKSRTLINTIGNHSKGSDLNLNKSNTGEVIVTNSGQINIIAKGGDGGGSSGLYINSKLICVLGGGGGGDNSTGSVGLGGSNLTSGRNGTGINPGAGGINGNGGSVGTGNTAVKSNTAGAGGGIFTDGQNSLSSGEAKGGKKADNNIYDGLSSVLGGAQGWRPWYSAWGSDGGAGFTSGGGGGDQYGGGGGGYSGGGCSGAAETGNPGSAGGGGSYLNDTTSNYIKGTITTGGDGLGGNTGSKGDDGYIVVNQYENDYDGDQSVDDFDPDNDGDGISNLEELSVCAGILSYSFYPGQVLNNDVYNIPTTTTTKNGITTNFNVAALAVTSNHSSNDYYGIRFTGHILIDTTGFHTFYLGSDDGSVLYINNILAVDNNGNHGYIEKSGRIYLEKGIYPLSLSYFQLTGPTGLELRYDGPGFSKMLVPFSKLYKICDFDQDGFENHFDHDSDNDGISDNIEAQVWSGFQAPANIDADLDGWDDQYDPSEGGTKINLVNSGGYAQNDFLDVDSDGDFYPDWVEGFDDDGSMDALNDLKQRAEAFATAGGNSSFYDFDLDSDNDTLPNFLEHSDGYHYPNYFNPRSSYYHDSDNDGLIDLFDEDSFGTASNSPDIDSDGIPDYRDNGNTITLPIELISFDANLKGNIVLLVWETLSEINNDYFTIEKSNDGLNFIEVTRLQGAGNSLERLAYSTTDNSPFTGVSYYRLKQTDFNGDYTYSEIKAINNQNIKTKNSVVFPNPVIDNQMFLNLAADSFFTNAEIFVYSMNGNLLSQQIISFESTKDVTIDLTQSFKLIQGVNFLKYKLSNNEHGVIKFIVK